MKTISDLRHAADKTSPDYLLSLLEYVRQTMEVAEEYIPLEGQDASGWVDIWSEISVALHSNGRLEWECNEPTVNNEIV